MSTKTITKRIALVAVAALAIGGFSAVSANAANTVLKCDVADGRSTATATFTTGAKCNGVAGPANSVIITIDGAAVANDRLTIAGAGATFASSGDATKAAIATNGLSATLDGSATTITVATPTVGTITVELYRLASGTIYEADATDTVTITVNKTASSGVVSTTYSKVSVGNGVEGATGIVSGENDTIAESGLTAGVLVAVIAVEGKDALDAALTSGTVKAEVTSGPGIVSVGSLAQAAGDIDYADGGRSDSATVSAADGAGATLIAGDDLAGVAYVGVYSDGTAGTSTIKITLGTTVLATKTVTFYGNVAKIVATQALSVASTTAATLGDKTSSTGYAVKLVLTDANGNPASDTITATSADTAVIASGDCAASATVPGTFYCEVDSASNTSGKSTTVTFSAPGASATTIKSDAVAFTLGGTIASVSLAFDAASYAPGAPVALNITAKDASGNPVFDGAKNDLTATAGLVFNYATGVSTLESDLDDLVFVKGVATVKTFAPLAAGSVSVAGTLGAGVAAAIVGSAITATADVEGDQNASLALDAANAATDAANNAYDEAQNATQAASDALAAVTALAAQVKSLIASVKKLTAAVAKLKK